MTLIFIYKKQKRTLKNLSKQDLAAWLAWLEAKRLNYIIK